MDDEDEIGAIRNHLESYIIGFLADLAYQSVSDAQEDAKLYERMRILGHFITPEVRAICLVQFRAQLSADRRWVLIPRCAMIWYGRWRKILCVKCNW